MTADAGVSATTATAGASICTRCGAAFGCAMADGASPEPCWCTLLPKAVPLPADAAAGCWCPACLQRHLDGLART
jgi:hypothetical protein